MAGPGDVPTILKLGNWPKASSYRGSKPGRNEGEGGSPHLLLCLPLPGSLPCLWQLWPLEEESFFLAPVLALQKPGHSTQHPLVLPLYTSVLLAVEQHSTLRAHAFLLMIVPVCPFGTGTESSCCCLGIYQRKQIPGALFTWLHVFLGVFSGRLGLCM